MTEPDANQTAHRIAREAAGPDDLPADLEAAWEAWIAGIQCIDERAKTLLRAAFEAGWEAGSRAQQDD